MTGALLALVLLGVPMSGQMPPYGGIGAYVADLAARRAKTLAALSPESVLVLWSAPARVYSGDTNYEYRQESNLLYLTGVAQEQTTLVLIPGAVSKKAILFVRAIDPFRALWFGRVMTPAEVSAASGIATVIPQRGTEEFDAFMTALLSGVGYRESAEEASLEFGPFFTALKQRRARIGMIERPDDRPIVNIERPEETAHSVWAREMVKRHPGITVFSAAAQLAEQRRIKTAYEQAVLKRGVEISAEAHVEGMRATRPGRWEYEVEATIEAWFHTNGAMTPGYPSIVGSGPNATTLHYLDSTRQMRAGDLLLVDAAGSFQGLTGDITRTYPVNGKFSAAQRAMYDLVLQAQEAGIAAARPGALVDEVTTAVRDTFADGLARLGLVRAKAGSVEIDAEVSVWFPHSPVHGIGMDVHETVDKLDPGVAFVIEPGLYLRPDAFDRLPPTLTAPGVIDATKAAFAPYRDIGVRVEDSFVMTATGPVMLSSRAPRAVDAIERIVGRAR